MSIVEPQFCRNEPFERFAFQITPDGIPELCSLPTEPLTKEDEVAAILRNNFGGSVERKVLVNKLQETLGIGYNAVQMRISRALRKGMIAQNGEVVSLLTD